MVENRFDPKVEVALGTRLRSSAPAEELYDLKKDPHQVHNVVDDANYYETRKKLRAQLMAELEKNDDPRLRGDTFDREPYNKKTRPGQTTRN